MNKQINDVIGTNKIISTKFSINGRGYYKCECLLCHNIRDVRADNLHKTCKSCSAKLRKPNVIDDLSGRQFGNWIVLKNGTKVNHWLCRDITTGTEREVFRGNLISGKSKGDGSVNSWGEQSICFLLDKYNIVYKKEQTFPDLRTDKNGIPRFDFGIYKNGLLYCLIEYDGRQHYSFDNNWKQTEEGYERQKYIDNLKNQYCQNKNLLLLRWNQETDLEEEIQKLEQEVGGNK